MSVERVDVPPVPGLDLQTGLLLAMLDGGTREWRGELSGVSEEAVVWQPVPDGHSIGTLMLHVAEVEAYWLHEVGAGLPLSEEDLTRYLSRETHPSQGLWPAPPRQPISWYFALLDEVRDRTRRLVSAWNAPDTAAKDNESGLLMPAKGTEFTRRWLLHHVLTHEAYHGGQAVLLSILHGKLAGANG